MSTAQASPTQNRSKAKNLIFLVADGMNHGTLALAEYHQRLHHGKSSNWIGLYNGPQAMVRSLMETSSASSIVTDSAAAGSAWSCGQKIPNGHLCMDASGKALRPFYDYAKSADKWTGLVTTTRITHATPASFTVSHAERNDEDAIAKKFLDSGVDIFMGGGRRHFMADTRDDGMALDQAFRDAGYTYLSDRQALLGQQATTSRPKTLGLFADSHIPYSVDRTHTPELAQTVPTLAEMMAAALQQLESAPNGFCLQVEGGRIDHAGHANDAAGILHDQLAFDDCIVLANRFLASHPDTLVIVTTDHGTGGCIMNGVGSRYNDSDAAFKTLAKVTTSFEAIGKWLNDDAHSPETLAEKLSKGLAIPFSADEASKLKALHTESRNRSADLLCERMFALTGVNFTSHNHTADHVEFAAYGAAHEGFPAFFENQELLGMLRERLSL